MDNNGYLPWRRIIARLSHSASEIESFNSFNLGMDSRYSDDIGTISAAMILLPTMSFAETMFSSQSGNLSLT